MLMLAAVATATAAQGGQLTANWTSGFVNGGVVPDNDLSGLVITETPAGWSGTVSDVEVALNLTGGWNGDIYAYLFHDDVMSVLLNQVGTPVNSGLGYGDSGFNVTLNDDADYSIHNYQDYAPTITDGVLQGTWQPDGAGLGVFNGMDASGDWTLYLADENPGGVMTLNSFGLTLDTASVPEPSQIVSMLVLSAAGGIGALWRLRRRK